MNTVVRPAVGSAGPRRIVTAGSAGTREHGGPDAGAVDGREIRPRAGGEQVSIPAVPRPAAALNSRTPSEGVITA
ncbi:hypothetical protein OIE73_08465 [Streptomyces hirsutus]|uniref:Uncharacterized protein n=1 Tax=Streptomyces hirsutus TaxID=35620 RepID=A0ABZ1GI04_9ACTN|nr:hypothetical protein [Streptomyces hirsutus]WSD05788.1 hypothetical protein OIE73_08465 [Streptomyces hirsutus]